MATIMRKGTVNDLEDLIKIVTEWQDMANLYQFGMTGDVGKVVQFLQKLINVDNADVLLIEKDQKVIGFMGIVKYVNLFSANIIAKENFWYVLKQYRGEGTKLLKFAQQWAIDNHCDYLICTASGVASNHADAVAKIYDRHGFKKFETDYIMEVL